MTCRICGNTRDNLQHMFREMMYGLKDEFAYIECSACQCLQIGEIPEDMSPYYPAGYCGHLLDPPALFGGFIKSRLRKIRDLYALNGRGIIGRKLSERLPAMPAIKALARLEMTRKKSLLDVGCGSGLFLYSLRNAGFRKVLGIDPHIEKDITFPNGLQILKMGIGDVHGKWDVITFIDSFEHVTNPRQTLKDAARLVKYDGWIVIRTPLFPNEAWRKYGADWVQIDAPRHLHIHSKRSIELQAHRVGLELVQVACDSDEFQFWGSEQYQKNIPLRSENSYFQNPEGSIFTEEQIQEFRQKAEDLNSRNEGDNAVFYLRKYNDTEQKKPHSD